jgi:hypothetical protein
MSYKSGMGKLPANALDEPRSPAQALLDLVDRLNGIPDNHPDLPKLARMIQVLLDHVAQRGATDIVSPPVRRPGSEFGLY